jgi:hypothetical protein
VKVVRHSWSLLAAAAKREELDSPVNISLGKSLSVDISHLGISAVPNLRLIFLWILLLPETLRGYRIDFNTGTVCVAAGYIQ